MPMKENRRLWFRSYGAQVLESVPYTKLSMEARGLLFDLRALASRVGVGDVVAMDVDDVAHTLRHDQTAVVMVLEELAKGGFVKRRHDGIEVLGFSAEQEPTTSAARMRKMRSKTVRMDDWKALKSTP